MSSTFAPRQAYRLLREFPASVAVNLSKNGYATYDGILSLSSAKLLRDEVDSLMAQGRMAVNKTHIVSADGTGQRQALQFSKQRIWEAELAQLSSLQRESIPALVQLQEDTTLTSLLSVYWPKLSLRAQAIKVQRNDGMGGCFPIHVDTSPSVDSRVVTALIYLNEEWHDGTDGGSLRIYDYPTRHHDISPKCGRLVLLSSAGIHHRVLPSLKQRYVITLWCSGTVRSTSVIPDTDLDVELRVARLLLSPQYRDMAFILSCTEEWEHSIRQSHDAQAADNLVLIHHQNLRKIRSKLPEKLCNDLSCSQHHQLISKLLCNPSNLLQAFHNLEAQGQYQFDW